MSHHRPTSLALAEARCPRAVDFYERGVTGFPTFDPGVGIAAHAFLERAGNFSIEVDAVPDLEDVRQLFDRFASKLLEMGRPFDGEPRPPLRPAAIEEGRELALRWYAAHKVPGPGCEYELGVGFASTPPDAPWTVVPYNWAKNRIRTILDVGGRMKEGGEMILLVRDYKSSWGADQSWLERLQQRVQAIAMADIARHKGWDWTGIRVEIANLRTRQLHKLEIWRDLQSDKQRLAHWRDWLSRFMTALDHQRGKDGRRPARPGLCCAGCPYLQGCTHGCSYMQDLATLAQPENAKGQLAAMAVIADDFRSRMMALAKAAVDESPAEVDGRRVGYVPQVRRRPTDDAARLLAQIWMGPHQAPTMDGVIGLLKAMELSKRNIEKALRQLYPREKEEREDALDQLTEPYVVAKFGIAPIDTDPREQAEADRWRKARKRTKKGKADKERERWGYDDG